MNTTTTEVTTEIGKAPAKARKATPRKRRMAREPGKPAAAGLDDDPEGPSVLAALAPAPAPTRKIAAVIALLEREQGATLAEMVETTGWLPHTARAALTGLKKKGRAISKAKVDDASRYTINKVPAA